MDNLARALPEREDRSRIAKQAYRHFGISLFELFKISRMSNRDIAARIHPHGMDRFETALARGRGVIVVTAHFGNFDLQAVSQAAAGIPLAIVSRTLHGNGANRFWMDTRKRSGLRIFPDVGAGRNILKWLRKGCVIGLTADQRTSPHKGGIEADFMGHSAWTGTAPAALALLSGAALIPARLERRPDGDHDLLIEKELTMSTRRTEESTRELTERINQVIAGWVRNRPEQYMWLHRRYRKY